MALRFLDGFDHYTTITQKWTGGGSLTFTGTGTRFGVGSMINIGQSASCIKALDAQSTWIVGVAFKLSVGFDDSAIISLRDGSTVQLDVRKNVSGNLYVTRGGSPANTLATSTFSVLLVDVWYYLELKAAIHLTTGSFDVHLNGAAVAGLSATGQNTRQTANNSANQIVLNGSSAGSIPHYFDDLYVCDSSGTTNNDFLGDVRVDTIYPTADGATTDLTPSTGTDNYAMVDESPPDSDTTYVSSATVGHLDTYAYENLESSAAGVFGIQIPLFARKDDAGARSVAPLIKTGATTAQGDDYPLAASYAYNLQVFETNPANGDAAWTVSDVNSSEFGVKVTA